jgi:uncharacterized membrane-anchored protein YhcB (DUF1043 family)
VPENKPSSHNRTNATRWLWVLGLVVGIAIGAVAAYGIATAA